MKKFYFSLILLFFGFFSLCQQHVFSCTSSGLSQEFEWIANVEIGSFSYSSGASEYSDFTFADIEVFKGTNIPVNLTPGYTGNPNTEYWCIWIDLNHDGTFTSDEQVFSGSSSGTTSGDFTLPMETLIGDTRLRVAMRYNNLPPLCEDFDYGEVEDYWINILENYKYPPEALFTGSPTIISRGEFVHFTDESLSNPTSWLWTFDGGTPATSIEQNPVITYNEAGTFSVSLTASNSDGSDTLTKIDYITVNLAPVANFSVTANNIPEGSFVTFYDQSTNNPTFWYWRFPGGTPSFSTEENPHIFYNVSGTYDVTLTASNSFGRDMITKKGYITAVTGSPPPCDSRANNNNYEWISGVQIGSFTNMSGPNGYSDFTNMCLTVSPNSNYRIKLKPGFSHRSYKEYWRIWIDFNKSCTFESNELVFEGNCRRILKGYINIPDTVLGPTRMRISMKYGEYPTACETFTYGEVEDYTIDFSENITPQ